jgi:hypothetical protein
MPSLRGHRLVLQSRREFNQRDGLRLGARIGMQL